MHGEPVRPRKLKPGGAARTWRRWSSRRSPRSGPPLPDSCRDGRGPERSSRTVPSEPPPHQRDGAALALCRRNPLPRAGGRDLLAFLAGLAACSCNGARPCQQRGTRGPAESRGRGAARRGTGPGRCEEREGEAVTAGMMRRDPQRTPPRQAAGCCSTGGSRTPAAASRRERCTCSSRRCGRSHPSAPPRRPRSNGYSG